MAGLIADNLVTAVLCNADLLGFICKNLWDIEQAPGGLVNGIRVHSLLSLALTCHAVSETALDFLWQEIHGMKPLLYIFPCAPASDNNQWILPDIISDDTWARFERYSCRVHSITLDAQLRAAHSSTIFLRLSGRQEPLFPNLQKLTVDMSFAADTSILLFLASPRLETVNIAFPSNAEAAMASTSVWTVGWKLPMLQSFTISSIRHAGGHRPRPLGTICPFTNFSGLRKLRRLKIESHSADVDFLVQLSSLPDLSHLQIVISQSLPTDSWKVDDGFRSLVSLYITTPVSLMPRVLRLIRSGSLTSLVHIDDHSQSYNEIGHFMQDFHTEIVSRFPSLLNLSINYRKCNGQLTQQSRDSTLAVFEPLCGLCKLREFTYNPMPTLETGIVELLLAPAWPEIRVFNIPLVQGPCPTYGVLCTLAKCCPHLSELSMPIAFPSDDAPLGDDHGPFSHKLRILSSPNTSVSRFASVARYLDGMFPFLISISGGQGWDQVESIVLEACQPVRRDQTIRGNPAKHLPPAETLSDEEDFADEMDDVVDVIPTQHRPPSEQEIAAASLIQRVYRKVLQRRLDDAQRGIAGPRAQIYASCAKEVSRLGGKSGRYLHLFLGPLPHILVCLEIVRIETVKQRVKTKRKLKKCGLNDKGVLDDLLIQINKANRTAIELQKQLSPSSSFHERCDGKELGKLVEKANDLVSSLPFKTSSDLSDDMHLAIKGIVTERSSATTHKTVDA
ncbi:hypothetical protein ARMSODRAFT_1025293 [Armillaria solidipes]|uniref:Uncharacterized protein n=1 Tax=Armillaria solidipes TaxID=1076256 RepID=A0A2H3B7E1_9AGAR|nr:hypothetical protein ARMSODRAFT_1025293 [Armillaria solidipes]